MSEQVLGIRTSGDDASFGDDFDAMMELLKWAWVSTGEGDGTLMGMEEVMMEDGPADEWFPGQVMGIERQHELEIERSPLLAALKEFGVPLTEAEREEAKERYGNWQDDKPAAVQDWWKDEKGEI